MHLRIAQFLAICLLVSAAPRSKKDSATYDQKQTGDYNIHVHLKDFQIITILGDDAVDEDDSFYDYDDSVFTIKPTLSSTTSKPDVTTEGSDHPYPIVSPSTTEKVLEVANAENATKPAMVNGMIPVFLQQEDASSTMKVDVKIDADDDKKTSFPVTNVAIVPAEDIGTEAPTNSALGEILHYKCAQGFSKDKRGRCRKVRRTTQIPLGIARFASSLMSKIRQNASLMGPIDHEVDTN